MKIYFILKALRESLSHVRKRNEEEQNRKWPVLREYSSCVWQRGKSVI